MKDVIKKIVFNIEKSESAYKLYVDEKKYYQALRIYKANKEIYRLIVDNSECFDVKYWSEIFNYLFHLEDWFEQFKDKTMNYHFSLQDEFLFDRLDGSPAYPINIIKTFKEYI